MKERPRQPFVPPRRQDTVRQELTALLREEGLTAKELSGLVGISEKEVLEHLEHLRIALHGRLDMTPPRCLECGFSFQKRERLKKPGRCPVCRSERITDPSFTIR
ncbi:transcriptional regulator [Geomonas paludis]|uniref:Transcriptional regulator n=1 Tax=Geomonas paludis TaxID=2740185 RepID=A0A6V8MXY2_9BACT|nr:transcriptional regulator [Geomonas paludis]UPU35214.1 transcriptional regulator [Geomonas paludis]GFO64940.1 transcriptional regulator [Geomonas paludis]